MLGSKMTIPASPVILTGQVDLHTAPGTPIADPRMPLDDILIYRTTNLPDPNSKALKEAYKERDKNDVNKSENEVT